VFKELWNSEISDKADVDPSKVFDDSPEVDEVLSISVEKLFAGAESSVCKLNVYRIEKFTNSKTETQIQILDPVQIKGLGGTAAEDETIDPEEAPSFWGGVGGFAWRALVVLAFALFFPFIVSPALRALFRQGNNLMNAGIWLFLTTADIVLIFVLVSFNPGTATIIGASLLLPCALFYNLKAMNHIEENA
ncbi:hypothetical protein OAU50_08515, partial [Planctomycetota bacterium]|nr:hypothetical protein [Planctomycetota bacterium]